MILKLTDVCYQDIGAASICSPYAEDLHAIDSYGSNGPDIFKVLADRGRSLEIQKMIWI